MKLQTTRDGSHTLFSERYNQTYHSIHGAEAESRHVFLKGAGIDHLLTAGQETHILEVGFGTGLNFFLTADLAMSRLATLSYYAFEKELLPAEQIIPLQYESLLTHAHLFEDYVAWRSSIKPPASGLLDWRLNDTLSLTLILGDAVDERIPYSPVDAIYLDAFSPEQNPELWTTSFFNKLGSALRSRGKLATYSAKGQIRRNLASAGFNVTKTAGPPGKREMVVATRP